MNLNIVEIRNSKMIRIGIDILISDLKKVDIILWNWDGIYGLLPTPIIENARDFIKTNYPQHWDNGKETRVPALIAPSKNRPKQLNFVWDQVREIEPLIANTLRKL